MIQQNISKYASLLKQWGILAYLRRHAGIEIEKDVRFIGIPWISCAPNSRIRIGRGATIVSKFRGNVAGMNHASILATLAPEGTIQIGAGSGLSGVTLVAAQSIEIGENSGLGVNVCIYDTDFHAEEPLIRRNQRSVLEAACAPVHIGSDVWIAANAMILKGVTIGDRSIIGAGSVVTRDVPPDSIYAGNPAQFIRKVKRSIKS